MSHIVIHDDTDGVTHYRQFDDQESAVAYLEDQQNRSQTSGGKLYALREVPFEVKFKIEVVDPDAGTADEVTPVSQPWVGEPFVPDEVGVPQGGEPAGAVAGEPIEAFASETFTVTEPVHAYSAHGRPGERSEVRRGLFGR